MNRSIKTIAVNIIHKKGSGKTIIPDAIFHISVMFIIAISLIFFSFSIHWLSWFYQGDEAENVIFINTPASFKAFVKEQHWEISPSLEYEWDAPYDYVTFGKWMHDKDAAMAVVFPENFDELVFEGEVLDILTYYRTDSLRYMDDKDSFIEWLGEYENFLKVEQGITVTEEKAVNVGLDRITTIDHSDSEVSYFWIELAKSLFPLIIFIMTLYISMSAGTNVIAGEKERGTFAAILMTPTKRIHIVLGNVIGVLVKALIPALVFLVLIFIDPVYRYLGGVLGIVQSIVLIISLALFISSITILISVLNDSVVSAQTAFLPIFLVMVGVCVTCIQNIDDVATFYYLLPIYGHFYGIGSSICGDANILLTLLCLVISFGLSFLCIVVSEKLLHKERFTVSGSQITDKDIIKASALLKKQSNDYVSKPKANIFGYVNNKRSSSLGFIIDQMIYPLAVLSIFQLLAMIPTIIMYMRKPEYSQFIYSLKDVSGVPDIIAKSFEVIAIFMGDPAFLIFMSIGYVGIIFTYILRVKFREKGTALTLGFTPKNIIKNYLKGLLLGFVLMGSTYLLLILMGQLTPSVSKLSVGNILTILAGILMWLPQGAAEEVMFRGFMLPRQGSRYGVGFALVFSSVLFAGFHSMNVGFTPLAFVNLFLIAFFFALLDYKVGHIWYSCAAHSMWNFLQGNVFGLQVSGNQGTSTILKANYSRNALSIFTGGDFGPEGGLAVTIVTSIAIAAIVITMRKKALDHQKT